MSRSGCWPPWARSRASLVLTYPLAGPADPPRARRRRGIVNDLDQAGLTALAAGAGWQLRAAPPLPDGSTLLLLERPAMAANAAIYFHEEGYRTDQPKLMGRHAAGEGFLKGFLAHAEVDELVAYADSEPQFQLLRQALRRLPAGATPACRGTGPGRARERRWPGPAR